ncbi:hypothetical protein [Thermomonospora amylolytica]|uniref:hypothetical protein n=1 Tax=Thermomonospora amylolytica TaxID=1411117 RepID=UPI000E6BB0CE|nr:hypothetical protein [Thermomonospora amylolytica]
MLARLEHSRLWPGAAEEALAAWARSLRDPYHQLFDPRWGCGIMACCPDPLELRRTLEIIAHALPPRDARTWRRHLAALDDLW